MTAFGSHDVGHANTPERQQAAGVLRNANAQYQAIRNRADLSEVGKQANIAAVHLKTQAKLADLRQSERDRVASERSAAESTLYGLPDNAVSGYTAISQRDAADRASTLATPRAASELLDRAQRNNDQHLASAVAQHAAQNGWASVVHEYVASDPAKQRALNKLGAIDASNGPADKMTSDMYFRTGTPPEVKGVSAAKLQALADQAGRTE